MWVLILLGFVITVIIFVISWYTNFEFFFIFRYLGLFPIMLGSIFMKPVLAALKQNRIPTSRKFRIIYAFIAFICLIIAMIVWLVFIVLHFYGAATPWVGTIIVGIALLAVLVSYVAERNGYYYKQFPEAMKTLKKIRRIYEEDNITIEYKRDISSYLCKIYKDLLSSQITGICICDAQGRLVTDSALINQVGKAVFLTGQYQKKFQIVKALEQGVTRINEQIDQVEGFLKEFTDLERAVYPDEELYAIWYEINQHAEHIIKYGLFIEKLEFEKRISWLDEFSPEQYITEQDIKDYEQMLRSVYDEIDPLDEATMNLVAEKCQQFQEKIEAEDLDTEMDISAYNQRHNQYLTRVVNLLLGVIDKTDTTPELPETSFSEVERILLNEKMEWARERIRY